jgi:hypothetical protein
MLEFFSATNQYDAYLMPGRLFVSINYFKIKQVG